MVVLEVGICTLCRGFDDPEGVEVVVESTATNPQRPFSTEELRLVKERRGKSYQHVLPQNNLRHFLLQCTRKPVGAIPSHGAVLWSCYHVTECVAANCKVGLILTSN